VTALTSVVVFSAVESIRFKRPLPPLAVSMPTVQPSNRKAWQVTWTALVIFTPIPTSMTPLAFLHSTFTNLSYVAAAVPYSGSKRF
jgi:hypothetical protein